MIAALFVEKDGCYFGLPDVDPWDEARDARLYDGPWPVVAHPPCNRWSQLARICESKYGYKIGEDGGTFASALASVRRWGGVLEHPAYTHAWTAHGLPWPQEGAGWQRCTDGGWVCCVSQGTYGHPARKKTWLYYFGKSLPPAMDWRMPVGKFVVTRGYNTRQGVKALPQGTEHLTPEPFRNLLIDIAKGA